VTEDRSEALEQAEQRSGGSVGGSAQRDPSGKQKIAIDATVLPGYYLG